MDIKTLKHRPIEERIEFIRKGLQDINSDNQELAFNLYLLIKGNNNFPDEFFASERVIVNDLMDTIDIMGKNEVAINELKTKLVGIYLSSIKNCGMITSQKTTPIPTLYRNILYLLDFTTMSALIDETKTTEFTDKTFYSDGFSVISVMASKMSMFANLLAQNIDIDIQEPEFKKMVIKVDKRESKQETETK